MKRLAPLSALALALLLVGATGEDATWRVTYYAPSFTGQPLGCGSDIYGLYDPADPTTAAAWRGTFECGERLRVTTDVRSIVVIVKDYCGGCDARHIDLSRSAWDALGGRDYAHVERALDPLRLPDTGTGPSELGPRPCAN